MSDIDLGIPGIADVIEIGRSSTYTTYRVRDTGTGQYVFIKVIHAGERPPSVVARFSAEQAVLVELASHPNLISVFGHGVTTAGEQFVVTEMTNLTTVAHRFSTPPQMTGPEVLRLGVRAAGALESVHRGGVVHGDLRADNIALSELGEPGVSDVGLVTLTGASVAASGDPRDLEYSSPEQLDGQYLTPASDQYSLAAVLYHLFAGEAAFVRPGDTSVVPVIKRIATDPPPDLTAKGVPPAAAEVVHKALGKSTSDRYPNLQAFARALQQAEVALGLPMTDLTVMTPDTHLPTVWGATTPAPAAPATVGPTPSSGPPGASGPPPAATAPAGSKSRTPLFIAIGVGLVIVLVAALLLTRGGSNKKTASSSSSATTTTSRRRSTTTSSTLGTDSATDFAPAGFRTVNEQFDHGDVEVFVPSDWTDSFPVQLQNGEPRLRVAPDATAFADGTFTKPGVQIDAFEVHTTGLDNPNNIDAFLDNFLDQPEDAGGMPGGPASSVCTAGARGNYPDDLGTTSDGQFTGRFKRLTGCRGASSVVVILATPADKSFVVQMVVQILTPADEQALPTIVGSVLVANFP